MSPNPNAGEGIRVPAERRLLAAEGYLELEMPTHALRELRVRRAATEDDAESLRLEGDAYFALEETENAANAYVRALEIGPVSAPLLIGLARALRRMGELGRAIEALEQAYRLDDRNAMVLFDLACFHALSGEKERALSWLGRAIRREQQLRQRAGDVSDFDAIREDPDFKLVVGRPGEED